MSDEPLIITIRHVRAAGMCPPGARPWFKRHNLDFKRFMKEGMPAEELLATGCALAARVVEVAKNGQQ